MKPAFQKNAPFVLAMAAIVLTVGLVSWGQQQSPGDYRGTRTDTTPKTNKQSDRDRKVRDLDDVIGELDRADLEINLEKIKEEISAALKKVDADKIRIDVEKALKEVDLEKIKKEVEASMAKVDFSRIKAEMAEAMKEIDLEKIQKEVKESMSKINWNEIREEMKKVKEIDMKELKLEMDKVKAEMKDLQPKLEKELANARAEIEKAKATMKEYKGFVDGLENDGLINKKETYTLKHKDGELFINGQKATQQTYNKYRSFLEKHKKFTIEKDNDDFDIDID